MLTGKSRLDWRTERDRVDLAAVATGLLGLPPGRRGGSGRKLYWRCPFHDDANPSFEIEPGKSTWKCWGCGERGDAATLVMRIENLSFPESVNRLTDRSAPPRTGPTPRPAPTPKPPEAAMPSGLPEAEALALVVEASARLWSPEGSEALAYLSIGRRLTLGTIRAARLGVIEGVRLPARSGATYQARGVVIPWFDRDHLALVKIRQPEGDHPKYVEARRDSPKLYPSAGTIRAGWPLVIVEGEFDALVLGQELAGLAAVVTLGSAGSSKPEPDALASMVRSPRWFVATDGDDAGDRAAALWDFPRARRVRPPAPFKDWTDAARANFNLRRWWCDMLGVAWKSHEWDHLASMRW